VAESNSQITIQDCLAALSAGLYWRGGICHLSAEVLIAPDYNDPDHRELPLIEYPQSLAHWDQDLEVEIRPGSHDAFLRAFIAVCSKARLMGAK
jgi:hypothetical protein